MENGKDEKIHTADVIVAENYLFTKFLLSEKLLKALNEMNYVKPSPIQLKIIPLARSRLDMIIQSKSGTGKTLSFSICLLETYDEDLRFPQSLIIVPTREIAVQITNTLNGLGKYMKHFKACEFIGGTDLQNDRKRIQTSKIVVGTPGRILHLIKNEIFNISNVKAIVFDEADKLFEQGHLGKDVQSIFKSLDPKNLQIIAATATVTTDFETKIKKFMKNPIGITPKQEAPVLLGIKQFAIELADESDNIQVMRNKLAELEKIFTKITFKQCLLFTDSQSKTESYGTYLNKLGWKNEVINGSQEQSQRLKVLNKLAKFKCRILITTDLMSRGIDIENINLVINLDLPYDCFTYLHRIGRAGRFGTHGIALTMLNGEKDCLKFRKMLEEIGSAESMVYKFPDPSISYNFWDFNNQQQNEKLEKIDGSYQNGNNVKLIESSRSEIEIVDENLMLLEITKKLIDQKTDKRSTFDTDSLLEEYENSCVNNNDHEPSNSLDNLLEDYEETNGNNNLSPTKNAFECSLNNDNHNGKKAVKNSHEESFNDFNVDNLLDEYERSCKSENVNENNNDPSGNKAANTSLQVPQEKRKIIFVKNFEESETHCSSSESSQSSDSEDESESFDDSEQESDIEEENQNENPQENYREFAQLNANDQEYQLYNQYVMDHYLQWRRIFYFQIANIQNFVNHNREDFIE